MIDSPHVVKYGERLRVATLSLIAIAVQQSIHFQILISSTTTPGPRPVPNKGGNPPTSRVCAVLQLVGLLASRSCLDRTRGVPDILVPPWTSSQPIQLIPSPFTICKRGATLSLRLITRP